MAETLEQLIRRLAGDRCEYCRLPESATRFPHVLDHIIARQHNGQTVFENLALCCGRCNQFKGPNIAGIDPATGKLARLFNPRTDRWSEHFRYDGAILIGLTAEARSTIGVLAINLPLRVAARQALIETGVQL